MVTITNREGENDFAQAVINFGGGWGSRLQAHLFPDVIPDDIDRTTRDFFWRYDQGLPSHYGFKPLDAPASPTTPFRKFLADCLTPGKAAELQGIFGRLYDRSRSVDEICYVHVGNGVNGKTALLTAIGSVFHAEWLTGSLKHDAKALMLDPAVAMLDSGDDVSDVWLKTMATSGTQVHVMTNTLPFGCDHGGMRRVKVIRWEKTIPEGQRDPDMAAKIARDPDFLIWLAEGLRRYQVGER